MYVELSPLGYGDLAPRPLLNPGKLTAFSEDSGGMVLGVVMNLQHVCGKGIIPVLQAVVTSPAVVDDNLDFRWGDPQLLGEIKRRKMLCSDGIEP